MVDSSVYVAVSGEMHLEKKEKITNRRRKEGMKDMKEKIERQRKKR